ncbi:hypothetical protein DPMN_141132 [Dreissena polymorpha]|uniref:Uncharacterized protein n=1 Tax=Dreissena polymorpha TaxID=45954 RepID=A0A9D4G8W4_DREPO|nr:hypothetical protein DPMN_141132 [Dreissena polymorpha]
MAPTLSFRRRVAHFWIRDTEVASTLYWRHRVTQFWIRDTAEDVYPVYLSMSKVLA